MAFTKRLTSVLLCLALLTVSFIVFVPEFLTDVSALTYRSGANSAHSTYKSSRFYKNFEKLELTGDGRTDVVAVALSQLGYQESSTAFDFDGEGDGSGDNTEYCYNMANLGSSSSPDYSYYWCATFVSWSLYQAQCTDQYGYSDWIRNHSGDSKYIWCEVSCSTWANQLRLFGHFQKSKAAGNTYTPQSGDLIFFSWDGATSSEDHIGIVVYSDDDYVYTVEGNTSSQNTLDANGGGVYFKKYAHDYKYITGYGVLPYETVDSVKKLDYSGANVTPGYYMCNASKYVYSSETATSSNVATLRYSMFEVTEIASNGRLKARGITTTTGETVEGYIENNTARVIQITSSATVKDQLISLVQHAKNVPAENYTVENYLALKSVISDAELLLNNESATDEQFAEMITALENAVNNATEEEIKTDDPDNYPYPTRDLYYNSSSVMTGDDVKWVQSVLVQLGYDVDIDGSFGPATKTAITQFQSDSGLDTDGSCGPLTRATLLSAWEELKLANIEVSLNAVVSNSENGSAITAAIVGDTIYLSYDLLDAESKKNINSVVEKNYSVTLTLQNPDGTVIAESIRENEDSGNLSATLETSGDIKATVSVSGEINLLYEVTVTVVPTYDLGDVDSSGEISTIDYLMVKRHVMETYSLDAVGILKADVDKSGDVDTVDYSIIKRVVQGTFVLA